MVPIVRPRGVFFPTLSVPGRRVGGRTGVWLAYVTCQSVDVMTLTTQAEPVRPANMTRGQLLVLLLLLASQFTLTVDFSILNVALPTVGASLGFAEADVRWIATAFALRAAGCTPPFGRICDHVDLPRVLLLGQVAPS